MDMNVSPRLLVPVLLACFLMLVWPIAHTIALRNALLTAGFLWALVTVVRRGFDEVKAARGPLLWLASFLVWIVLQAIIFAVDRDRALAEMQGQWIPALAAGFFGFVLGRRTEGEGLNTWLWRGIVLILVVQAAATLAFALVPLLEGGMLLRRVGGLTEGPDKSNYLTVTLACVLLAALATPKDRRLLPKPVLLALTLLVFATLYVEQIRNGLISLVIGVMLLVAFLSRSQQDTSGARLAALGLLGAALIASFTLALTDPRWQRMLESVHKAWTTDTRVAVIKGNLTEAGGDPSAYLRLAMLKEGLAQVAAHPLGVGYHRNAFGHALRLAYGQGSGHSHSSLLDLAIGVGIPGGALLVGFFIALMRTGWYTERTRADGLGLLLFLLAGITLVRAALDSCLRDHMLQQSFFLFGLLLATSAISARAEHES